MTISNEIREEAARLHDEMTYAEDEVFEYRGQVDAETLADLEAEAKDARIVYDLFCTKSGFRLLTDASGLFLRCSKTNIPLVDTDECVEGENGELVMVERADAA